MRALLGFIAVCVAVLLVACSPGAGSSSPDATDSQAIFESVVDGDTIETSLGTIRIIGVDAPENGTCGYAEAAALVSSLLSVGDPLVLDLPDGQNDTDQYARLLRHVDTPDGVDVGLSLLTAGLAVARYDSVDGYPAHPRESQYRSSQVATSGPNGEVVTVDCKVAADAMEQERLAMEQERLAAEQLAAEAMAAPPAVDEWWLQYGSCAQLKRNTNGHSTGPFARDNPQELSMYNWFDNGTGNNGDGDGDGLACE